MRVYFGTISRLLGPQAVLSAFALPGSGNLLSCKCFSCFEAQRDRGPFRSYSLVALSPAILYIKSDLFNGCLPLLPLVHQLGEPRRQGCVGCYTQGLVLYPGLCRMCLLRSLLEHLWGPVICLRLSQRQQLLRNSYRKSTLVNSPFSSPNPLFPVLQQPAIQKSLTRILKFCGN